MIDIKRYFPKMYENVLEVEELTKIENSLLESLNNELQQVGLNQFIISCNSDTLKDYETMLKIVADPKDDIEFRRKRILNRLSLSKPFTIKFLKQKLDEIIGVNKYEIKIDYTNYIMYVESNIVSQNWFHEVYVTINKMKPANIVFINKPLTNDKIVVNEEVNYSVREYNYKLGTKWRLGTKPFKSLNYKGVVKMAEGKSVQEVMLNELRIAALNKIAYVKINNTVKISNFLRKEIVNDQVVVEYTVLKKDVPTEVTKVDLYDSSNNKVTSISMYVPVIEDLELKHILRVEEGIN